METSLADAARSLLQVHALLVLGVGMPLKVLCCNTCAQSYIASRERSNSGKETLTVRVPQPDAEGPKDLSELTAEDKVEILAAALDATHAEM